jgi:predicted DNA-binding ribbon-helix-helix protein
LIRGTYGVCANSPRGLLERFEISGATESLELEGTAMKSLIVKRSIIIDGHKTSVSLEDAFWQAVKEIALLRGTTLANIVSSIDAGRESRNLSSNIRLFVLDFYHSQLNKEPTARTTSPSVRKTGST